MPPDSGLPWEDFIYNDPFVREDRASSPAIASDGVIHDIFGVQGVLAHSIPGYERREGQVQLSRAIHTTMTQGGVLVAEAPCGVGKSYAAIVPATALAKDKRKKITERGSYGPTAIVTATIALQEQLMNKDLPALEHILPWKFAYALLKGRSNYLCLRKLAGTTEEEAQIELDNIEDEEKKAEAARFKRLLDDIRIWSEETSTGDRSDFPEEVTDADWRKFSATADYCLRKGCRNHSRCWTELARKIAFAADVVVANYHVLLSGGGAMLQRCGDLVCDEAHEMPRLARDLFGWSLTFRSFYTLSEKIRDLSVKTEWADPLPPSIGDLRKEASQVFASLLMTMEENGTPQTLKIKQKSRLGVKALFDLVSEAKSAALAAIEAYGDGISPEHKAELELMAEQAETQQQQLIAVNTLDDPDHWVYWLQYRSPKKGGPYVAIEGHPFRVAPILRKHVFNQFSHESVTCMSATLQTGSGFEFIRRECGVPDHEVRELVVPTPFNMETQAALIIDSEVRVPPKAEADDYTKNAYNEEVATSAAMLADAMGGRTLCLFTSWSMLEYVWQRWSRSPRMQKYNILKQGDAPTQRLVQMFTDDETSILLGVASLWQGVDVPGDALRGLFVHKIPFPVPSHPLNKAMSDWLDERYGEWAGFNMWSIPQATMALQQGMGRLIRSTTDTGVIVVADSRLLSSRYAQKIRKALPSFSVFGSIRAARNTYPELFKAGKRESDD